MGRRLGPIIAGFVLVTTVGCAADQNPGSMPSDDATSPTPTTSEAASPTPLYPAFLRRVERLCTTRLTLLARRTADLSPDAPDFVRRVRDDVVPLVQGLIDDLAALSPPPLVADVYAEALTIQQGQIDQISARPRSLYRVDGTGADALWDSIGAPACGSQAPGSA